MIDPEELRLIATALTGICDAFDRIGEQMATIFDSVNPLLDRLILCVEEADRLNEKLDTLRHKRLPK